MFSWVSSTPEVSPRESWIVDIYPANQPEVYRIVSFRFSELVVLYTC